MHAQIQPDHRIRAHAHLAGADRMVVGLGIGAAVIEQIFVADGLRAGQAFGQHVRL